MAEKDFDSERITRYFSGRYSEMDEIYVHNVFCDDEKENELRNLLSDQFDKLPDVEMDRKGLSNLLYRIHYDINTRLSLNRSSTFDRIVRWSYRIAGLFALPIVIFFGFHALNSTKLKKESWVEIKAPAWTRARFSLPDGTMGWLNSNSSIKYMENFTADRQVTLQGEAFFDVYKDSRSPFIVNTGDVALKVLGTRFNIASYENEENVDVVLEEGKLLFMDKNTNKSYSMHPNELITYSKINRGTFAENVQSQKYIAWTEGKLVFRNDPLDIIARKLERWYNIEVGIEGNLSQDLRLRATFVDETLEEVLKILKYSLPIDYKIENRDLNPDDTYQKKKVKIILKKK